MRFARSIQQAIYPVPSRFRTQTRFPPNDCSGIPRPPTRFARPAAARQPRRTDASAYRCRNSRTDASTLTATTRMISPPRHVRAPAVESAVARAPTGAHASSRFAGRSCFANRLERRVWPALPRFGFKCGLSRRAGEGITGPFPASTTREWPREAPAFGAPATPAAWSNRARTDTLVRDAGPTVASRQVAPAECFRARPFPLDRSRPRCHRGCHDPEASPRSRRAFGAAGAVRDPA